MGKGYAEGPAAEEAEAARSGATTSARSSAAAAQAGVGIDQGRSRRSTCIGEAGEVDPDELFASGKAWGHQGDRSQTTR